MKLIFTILLLIARHASAEPTPNNPDAARLTEIKQVLWPKAYREQDTALLAQILADEFQMIDAEGKRSTKKEEIEYVRTHRPSYDSFRFVINRLEVFENRTAIVAGTGFIETKAKGQEKGSRTEYQSSNVFIERDGRWQAIASHVSGVKKRE
jgi:hypothetical protein